MASSNDDLNMEDIQTVVERNTAEKYAKGYCLIQSCTIMVALIGTGVSM